MADFINTWLNRSDDSDDTLVVLVERPGARAAVIAAVDECVTDHLAGLDIIARIGHYKKALAYIRNRLPTSKRVRSGDFAEILATEYIDQCTAFRVPIKKLRWKDDRAMPMRGNDVLAVRLAKKRWIVLKAESKSRATLGTATLAEAIEGLEKDGGRPNPSSLAFVSARLREQNRDEEAEVFEDLQIRTLRQKDVEHMVFTLSGNDPVSHFQKHRGADGTNRRHLVGCIIVDHQDFINSVFTRIDAGRPS